MPKPNQYQSLHTTVIGPQGERIEIQIRTHEMHSIAENGIAAHWKYKEGKLGGSARDVEWVNRLVQWNKNLKDPNEFLETVKIDLFAEDVFVFTPQGEVKEFPYGSTPIDFAYAIHSELGNKCVGAKVNGKIVSLKYRLKSGDTVEILTSPNATPNKDWLKIVKTSKAKSRIRNYIKTQERTRATQLGKELLEKELKNYNQKLSQVIKTDAFKDFLEKRHHKQPEDLFIYIGYGRISPTTVVQNILPTEVLQKRNDEKNNEQTTTSLKTPTQPESKNVIIIDSIDNILIRFGRCCNPIPGDSIVGVVTRGRGVTVHKSDCPRALDLGEERRIEVQWHKNIHIKRNVKIRIISHDMPGILADMSQTIASFGVNISSANIRTNKDRKAISIFEVEVFDKEQLLKVISGLESKKSVISVERLSG
jgi:GTP pyrophosphokinase